MTAPKAVPENVEVWPTSKLRAHPENGSIFGEAGESPEFDSICESIRKDGIWEPLVVKVNGTILSGHLRWAAAEKLGLEKVPVRVWPPFASYLDEVRFVIRSNTDRRQLTPREIAFAFKRLKEIPREQGGAKAKRGRPEKDDGTRQDYSLTRDAAAATVGVGRDKAEACEVVFGTPGVPEELKAAVDRGDVAPTRAAKEIRAEVKRQGGEIKSPTALAQVATPPTKSAPPAPTPESDREKRLREAAALYHESFARLVKAYREVDTVLTRLPLKNLLGPTEHHEYAGIIRDIAIRACRELEAVDGSANAGKQIALAVIQGGRS